MCTSYFSHWEWSFKTWILIFDFNRLMHTLINCSLPIDIIWGWSVSFNYIQLEFQLMRNGVFKEPRTAHNFKLSPNDWTFILWIWKLQMHELKKNTHENQGKAREIRVVFWNKGQNVEASRWIPGRWPRVNTTWICFSVLKILTSPLYEIFTVEKLHLGFYVDSPGYCSKYQQKFPWKFLSVFPRGLPRRYFHLGWVWIKYRT